MERIKGKYISTKLSSNKHYTGRPSGVATLLFQDTKSLDRKTVHISVKKNIYLLILLEEVIEL
jgi:hypothetical protein